MESTELKTTWVATIVRILTALGVIAGFACSTEPAATRSNSTLQPAKGARSPAQPARAPEAADLCESLPDSPRTGKTGRPPNIILIMVDTLRPDHLGAWGYGRDTSGNLDRWIEDTVRFDKAYVTWPETSQSVASMLTSRYSAGTGVRTIRTALPRDVVTLAEILACYGYHNAGFVSNGNVGREFNFDQGFAEYTELWRPERGSTGGQRGSENAATVGPAVISWLDRAPKEPFFLWAFFIDPHGPYEPPAPYDKVFTGDDLFKKDKRQVKQEQLQKYQRNGESNVNRFIAAYDGEIKFFDFWLGKLLDKIASKGLDERSIIAFCSDHGEALGEHGFYFQHGTSAHNPQLRVPLAIRAPGLEPRTVTDPVSLLDLSPTLLAIAGLGPYPGFEGQPLLGKGALHAGRPVISEWTSQLTVVRGNLKLLLDFNTKSSAMYDLTADPGESKNLALETQDQGKQMLGIAQSWLKTNVPRQPSKDSAKSPKISKETMEQLKRLGYAD